VTSVSSTAAKYFSWPAFFYRNFSQNPLLALSSLDPLGRVFPLSCLVFHKVFLCVTAPVGELLAVPAGIARLWVTSSSWVPISTIACFPAQRCGRPFFHGFGQNGAATIRVVAVCRSVVHAACTARSLSGVQALVAFVPTAAPARRARWRGPMAYVAFGPPDSNHPRSPNSYRSRRVAR